MAWVCGGVGTSVCVDKNSDVYYDILDMDADIDGYPKISLHYHVKEWFGESTMDDDWWIDDLGNLWFEFATRGEALLFTLEFL